MKKNTLKAMLSTAAIRKIARNIVLAAIIGFSMTTLSLTG